MYAVFDDDQTPIKFLMKNGKWTTQMHEARWWAYSRYALNWIREHPEGNYKLYRADRNFKYCPLVKTW